MDTKEIKDIKDLKTGDVIRSKYSKESYVITANYGSHAVGVRTMHVSNRFEWELVVKEND